jgi:Ca2+-binding EF-hand superfamily protein
MTERRREKKSESIEVRVPYELKQEFMQRAAQEGISASDLIRRFMADYLAPASKESRPMYVTALKPAALASAMAAAAVFTLASPSVVQATPDLKAVFDRFDGDKSGAISAAEFAKGMTANQLVLRGPAAPPGAEKKVMPYSSEEAPPKGAADTVIMRADVIAPVGHEAMVIPMRGAPPAAGTFVPPAEMTQQEFARHDLNRDGKVEFAEFRDHHRRLMQAGFRKHDANGDGYVDASELAAIRKLLPPGATGLQVSEFDKNGDSKISFDEFTN